MVKIRVGEVQEPKEYHVLSLGAGVQSTTLYLMFLRGEIQPQIDAAIFADTQDEPGKVYEHLNWLGGLNGPRIISRSKGCLGDDLMRGENSTGQRFAAIPAYTQDHQTGKIGRTRRQCTKEYKITVIERAIRRDIVGLRPRQRIPKTVQVYQYIGISLDEKQRAIRHYERWLMGETKCEPRFPLIERLMTRTDCESWLKDKVPHHVPRSACVYCPFHDDGEWLKLKQDDPAGWMRAVQVDAALRAPGAVVNRGMNAPMYLHHSCQPLVQIDFKPKRGHKATQIPMGFALECMGVCGV